VVAHRATMLRVMDTILVLNDGRVTHFGGRDNVLGQLSDAQAADREAA
jgi:ABC-type protease/lipase transport system fused ATPase/permease subunit